MVAGRAASHATARFSTAKLDPRDQFDAWREQVNMRFGLADVSREGRGAFHASIETREIGRLGVSSVFGDAMTFDRRSQHAACRDRDVFHVGFLLVGRAVVEQFGHRAELLPGELVLCDVRHPMRIRFDAPFRQRVLHCDRAQLEALVPDLGHRVARRIEGRGSLFSAMWDYVSAVAMQPARVETAESSVAQHALELLALLVGGRSSETAASRICLARVQRYIEDNLADPRLSPSAIARQHGISRRYLYRLFEARGESVAGFIRHRRLARCRAALGDKLHLRRSVTEIALSCGFNDSTTFGRAFRLAFGMTPREYRRAALVIACGRALDDPPI